MKPEKEPASFVIELGINAALGVEGAGVYPLQHGLAKVTDPQTGQGVPHWYSYLVKGANLSFRVWDITPLLPSGEPASQVLDIRNFEACFLEPADPKKQLKDPFEPNPVDFSTQIFPLAHGAGKTSVYPAPLSGWYMGDGSPPLGQTFKLERKGIYLLRVSIDVVIEPSNLRTYLVDPEIIVGGSGGPGEIGHG